MIQNNEQMKFFAPNLLCTLQSVMESFAEKFIYFSVLLQKFETHVSFYYGKACLDHKSAKEKTKFLFYLLQWTVDYI